MDLPRSTKLPAARSCVAAIATPSARAYVLISRPSPSPHQPRKPLSRQKPLSKPPAPPPPPAPQPAKQQKPAQQADRTIGETDQQSAHYDNVATVLHGFSRAF